MSDLGPVPAGPEDAARRSCAVLPPAPGVYRFRDGRGRVMYLGRATNLRTRTQSYWGNLDGRGHLRRMVPQIAAVEALVCASPHEATWLERNLLERSLPRWNRTAGGQEVPVWLALDAGPRRPGLRVVHLPAEVRRGPETSLFGPYLGSERAALIRSGLARVWPLAYTDDDLTSSERDLARARGVSPRDRARLATSIAAALAGAQDAVAAWRAGLIAARQRAAAGLAYELAERIETELTAIDWATGVQRVTRLEGPGQPTTASADVHGWYDGVLVSLEIRGGRMNRWHQRLLPREPVTKTAITPPAWRDFAGVNARLGALLARTATQGRAGAAG